MLEQELDALVARASGVNNASAGWSRRSFRKT